MMNLTCRTTAPTAGREWREERTMTDQQVIEQLVVMQCKYTHIRASDAEREAIERAKEVLAERN